MYQKELEEKRKKLPQIRTALKLTSAIPREYLLKALNMQPLRLVQQMFAPPLSSLS